MKKKSPQNRFNGLLSSQRPPASVGFSLNAIMEGLTGSH